MIAPLQLKLVITPLVTAYALDYPCRDQQSWHCVIAVSAASLTFGIGTDNPLALGLALLGSQLPDLDTTTSTIGQICFPLSNWLEDNFPHRTITHSLLATAVIGAITQCQAPPDRTSYRLLLQSPHNRSSSTFRAFNSLCQRHFRQERSTIVLSESILDCSRF